MKYAAVCILRCLSSSIGRYGDFSATISGVSLVSAASALPLGRVVPFPARAKSPIRGPGTAQLDLSVGPGGNTIVRDLFHSAPMRVLFPLDSRDDVFQAALAYVSGGLVGGDQVNVSVRLAKGAKAMVIGQAAEKVYRSLGPDCVINNHLEVGPDAWLEWLPQETIIFDSARLRRRTQARIHPQGRLLAGEILVFGRAARGEGLRNGLVHDGWDIGEADGQLNWRDVLHMDGDLAALLADPHTFDGAAAYGTMIYVDASAKRLLSFMREVASQSTSDTLRIGVTALRNILLVRFLGKNTLELRNAFARSWAMLRGEAAGLPCAMPRLWAI